MTTAAIETSGAKAALIGAVAAAVVAAADELTALDQAIGDGDHGSNMKRGFTAVADAAPALSEKPWPELLKGVGTTLVMKVGGASGPLYGTLFLELGKHLGASPGRAELTEAFGRAIEAVKARGKAEPGQKTMLDVLVPVHEALAAGADAAAVAEAARLAADRTVPMQATRGRASFLGERSIGHMDPGSRSSALMVEAVATALPQALAASG